MVLADVVRYSMEMLILKRKGDSLTPKERKVSVSPGESEEERDLDCVPGAAR